MLKSLSQGESVILKLLPISFIIIIREINHEEYFAQSKVNTAERQTNPQRSTFIYYHNFITMLTIQFLPWISMLKPQDMVVEISMRQKMIHSFQLFLSISFIIIIKAQNRELVPIVAIYLDILKG